MLPTTEKILAILDYIRLNESTKTTHQMFRFFEINGDLNNLVYAFPFMVKGHVLAFEALLSKEVIKQANIERPEIIDKDIIESMQQSRF